MTNKILGHWLMWTLVGALVVYLGGNEELGGLIIIANWVFVIIAGLRLIKP